MVRQVTDNSSDRQGQNLHQCRRSQNLVFLGQAWIFQDEDIITVVKMYLEHRHYEVITAGDGQDGLRRARTEKPDLIILDLMLPKMDGYKVCALLKKDAKYARTPIVLFTAKAQEKDVQLGEEVGADAYVTKPFAPEVLLSKIEELIKK